MSCAVAVDERLAGIDRQAAMPHNRLLLACAGHWESDVTTGTVAALLRRGGIDWPALIESAIRHGVAQIVAAQVTESTEAADVPATVITCLCRLRDANGDRNRILLGETARLVESLRAAGIRRVVLKGAALAPTVYPDPALRNFADIDILVGAENLARAAEVVRHIGYPSTGPIDPRSLTHECAWECSQDILTGTLAPELIPAHAPRLVSDYTHRVVLELHSGLIRKLEGTPATADMAPFWESVRQFEIAPGRTAEMLGPEAMLVHLAIHASEHAFGRLMFPIDAAFVIRRYGAEIVWDRVVELARHYSAVPRACQLLHYSRQICGAAIPDHVFSELRAAGRIRVDPAVAQILTAGSAVGSEPRIRRLLATRSLMEGLRGASRIIFQPVPTMRTIYGVRSLPAVWFFYAVRPFLLAARAARILVRAKVSGRP